MRHLLFVGQGMVEGLGNKKSETKDPRSENASVWTLLAIESVAEF